MQVLTGSVTCGLGTSRTLIDLVPWKVVASILSDGCCLSLGFTVISGIMSFCPGMRLQGQKSEQEVEMTT